MFEDDDPSGGANAPALSFKMKALNDGGRNRLSVERGAAHKTTAPPRLPRLSRLMALAIHFQGLVDRGAVKDYADVARLAGLSRARVTQIMNLTLLAPDIQERILFLPRVERGRDPVAERHVRGVAKEWGWEKQRELWKSLGAIGETDALHYMDILHGK